MPRCAPTRAHLASSFNMVRRKAWFSAKEAAFTNWHLKALRKCPQTQPGATALPACTLPSKAKGRMMPDMVWGLAALLPYEKDKRVRVTL